MTFNFIRTYVTRLAKTGVEGVQKYLSQSTGKENLLREQRGLPCCAECTSELCGHAFNTVAVLKHRCVVG